MTEDQFTLIDAEGIEARGGHTQPEAVAVRVAGDRVRVAPDTVRAVFGWELKPEGLCRAGACVPVHDRSALVDGQGIDLTAFAAALGRPLALDVAEGAAVLGAASAERARQLASLEAPDFTLPDLTGKLHSLSEHRGKKVLLIVYASW